MPSGAASLPCDLQGSPAPPLKRQLAGLRLSTWAPSPRTKSIPVGTLELMSLLSGPPLLAEEALTSLSSVSL